MLSKREECLQELGKIKKDRRLLAGAIFLNILATLSMFVACFATKNLLYLAGAGLSAIFSLNALRQDRQKYQRRMELQKKILRMHGIPMRRT